MYTVPPFVPAIIERLPESTRRHANVEAYYRDSVTAATAPNPGVRCRFCFNSYRSTDAGLETLCSHRGLYQFTEVKRQEGESLVDYLRRRWVHKEKTCRHKPTDLIPVARVETELGDDLALYAATPRRTTARQVAESKRRWWLASDIAPQCRGQLPLDRPSRHWTVKYRLYPSYMLYKGWVYRRPQSVAERRHLAAATLEAEAPRVRAKRGKNGLVDAWDDKPIPMVRSWKKKKVRKQWMVNQ